MSLSRVHFQQFGIIIISICSILGFIAFILYFIQKKKYYDKYKHKIYYPDNKYKHKIYYPDGKKMAYISTWDDTANINSYVKINELCKQEHINIPLTMFLDTKMLVDNPTLIQKYKKLLNEQVGHTVESHSVTHPSDPHNPQEYIESQKELKRIFGNQYGKTYAFPYGTYPKKAKIIDIIKKYYIAARLAATLGYFNRDQLYSLHTFQIEKITESDIKAVIDCNKTLITYGHGITEIGGWNPISEKEFIKHLKILKKYESDIWFVTLPKFIEYLHHTKQL